MILSKNYFRTNYTSFALFFIGIFHGWPARKDSRAAKYINKYRRVKMSKKKIIKVILLYSILIHKFILKKFFFVIML